MEFSLKTSESFDEVMRHYTPTVYRIAYTRLGNAADAEVVSQDVFVRYFKAGGASVARINFSRGLGA